MEGSYLESEDSQTEEHQGNPALPRQWSQNYVYLSIYNNYQTVFMVPELVSPSMLVS